MCMGSSQNLHEHYLQTPMVFNLPFTVHVRGSVLPSSQCLCPSHLLLYCSNCTYYFGIYSLQHNILTILKQAILTILSYWNTFVYFSSCSSNFMFLFDNNSFTARLLLHILTAARCLIVSNKRRVQSPPSHSKLYSKIKDVHSM